jgi:hypothetical protein
MENNKPTIFCGVYHEMKEEAEQARVKYGYGDDNYYVDKLIN